MKAALLEDVKKLTVKEVLTPKIDENEILLKIKSCAICGSDIKIFLNGSHRINMPEIIGHEISGVIEKIGLNVKGFKIGDRLSLGADIPCGECIWCKSGYANNCKKNIAFGHEIHGGFAEYVKLDKRIIEHGPLTLIPNNVSYDEASLAEPLACCINGIELVKIKEGSDVCIMGCGPIGIFLALLSRNAGAKHIIMTDIDNERLSLAKKITGADFIINSKESDISDEVHKVNPEGIDIIFTANNNIQSHYDALKIVKVRGTINLFGGLPKGAEKLSLESDYIHRKEFILTGSHGSTPLQHKKALDLISSGKINVKELISKNYPLEKINEAMNELINNKNNLKIIINP